MGVGITSFDIWTESPRAKGNKAVVERGARMTLHRVEGQLHFSLAASTGHASPAFSFASVLGDLFTLGAEEGGLALHPLEATVLDRSSGRRSWHGKYPRW